MKAENYGKLKARPLYIDYYEKVITARDQDAGYKRFITHQNLRDVTELKTYPDAGFIKTHTVEFYKNLRDPTPASTPVASLPQPVALHYSSPSTAAHTKGRVASRYEPVQHPKGPMCKACKNHIDRNSKERVMEYTNGIDHYHIACIPDEIGGGFSQREVTRRRRL